MLFYVVCLVVNCLSIFFLCVMYLICVFIKFEKYEIEIKLGLCFLLCWCSVVKIKKSFIKNFD